MSRSRRKTPITGHTTCESEKEEKQEAHRRERRLINSILAVEPLREVLPIQYEVSRGEWWGKDGKAYWSKERVMRCELESTDLARLMRK